MTISTARRYASAVHAVVVCLSVCPSSVTGQATTIPVPYLVQIYTLGASLKWVNEL